MREYSYSFRICRMKPTSGIVSIPCADAAEGVVQLPADSKRPSKLSGAWAGRLLDPILHG